MRDACASFGFSKNTILQYGIILLLVLSQVALALTNATNSKNNKTNLTALRWQSLEAGLQLGYFIFHDDTRSLLFFAYLQSFAFIVCSAKVLVRNVRQLTHFPSQLLCVYSFQPKKLQEVAFVENTENRLNDWKFPSNIGIFFSYSKLKTSCHSVNQTFLLNSTQFNRKA